MEMENSFPVSTNPISPSFFLLRFKFPQLVIQVVSSSARFPPLQFHYPALLLPTVALSSLTIQLRLLVRLCQFLRNVLFC
ncbi:hypothetical protein BT69DRAFT_257563 [Atractiella rhizophila]|nr:hypothetical protein BT69DRAFT_257563 [Atractiella rhizophila]